METTNPSFRESQNVYNFPDLLNDPDRPSYAEERLFTRQWGVGFTDRVPRLRKMADTERKNIHQAIAEYAETLKEVGRNRSLPFSAQPAISLPEWVLRRDFSLHDPETFYACLTSHNLPVLLDEVEARLSHLLRTSNPNLSTECSRLVRLPGKLALKEDESVLSTAIGALRKDIEGVGKLLRAAIRQERARQVLHILALMQMHRDGVSLVGHQGAVHMLSQFGNQGQDVKILREMRLHLLETAEKCERDALAALGETVSAFLKGESARDLDKALNDVWSAERAVDAVADSLVLFSGSIWRGSRIKSASHCVARIDKCWLRLNECVDECKRLLPKQYSSEFDRTTLPVCLEILQSNFVRRVAKFVEEMEGLCKVCEQIWDKPWCGELTNAWLQSTFNANICKMDERFKAELGKLLESERWTAEPLRLGDQEYMVCRCAHRLRAYIEQYQRCFTSCSAISTDWRPHCLELVQFFNSQSCQLLMGAGAVETAGLKSITIRHMSVGLRTVQLLQALIEEVCCPEEAMNDSTADHLCLPIFARLRSDIQSHKEQILSKIIVTSVASLKAIVERCEWGSSSPSVAIQQAGKCLKVINDQTVGILDAEHHNKIIQSADKALRESVKDKSRRVECGAGDGENFVDKSIDADMDWYANFLHSLLGCNDIKLDDL